MGVGLLRSLQPPGILWIHWRVNNSIANTSKGVLFLPLSDVYVRSFLYLLYTLIKLYYTKALSDQASSLTPDWIFLWRPRIPESFWGSATIFQHQGKSLGVCEKILPDMNVWKIPRLLFGERVRRSTGSSFFFFFPTRAGKNQITGFS